MGRVSKEKLEQALAWRNGVASRFEAAEQAVREALAACPGLTVEHLQLRQAHRAVKKARATLDANRQEAERALAKLSEAQA